MRDDADQLREWVRSSYRIDLATLDRVAHGADEAAEMWHGVADDGARYAVKVSGRDTVRGAVVCRFLDRQGVPGVPPPVLAGDGRVWGGGDPAGRQRRLALSPWVSDRRALAGGMTADHWRAYGSLLARVHANPDAEPLTDLLPREEYDHRPVTERARAVDRRVAALLSGGAPVDPLVGALLRAWPAADVAAMLDLADRLGDELRRRPAPQVLCHGDPHQGNLLLDGDDRVWLIDWDDVAFAPRERDLMFVLGGVLSFFPVSPREQGWFFQGYGPVELNPVELAYHRCVRALDDIAGFAGEVLDTGRSPQDRQEAWEILQDLVSAAGPMSAALASLRDLGHTGDGGFAPGLTGSVLSAGTPAESGS